MKTICLRRHGRHVSSSPWVWMLTWIIFFAFCLYQRPASGFPAYLQKRINDKPPADRSLTLYPTNGPYGISINSLFKASNFLFAATVNGLYRTTDEGLHWKKIGLGSDEDANITALTSLGDTLFASTARQVYRCDNMGADCHQLNTEPGPLEITALVVVGDKLWAGANGSGECFCGEGFFWMPLQGGSWTYDKKSQYKHVRKIVNFGATAIASTDGRLQYLDALGEWNEVPNSPSAAFDIEVSGTQFAILVPNVGVAVLQLDKTKANPFDGPWTFTGRDQFEIRVAGLGHLLQWGSQLLLGADSGLFRLNKSTMQWESIGNFNFREIHTLAAIGATLFVGTKEGVFLSKDNGVSWDLANNGLGQANVYKLLYYHDTLFAASNVGLQISTTSGEAWSAVDGIVGRSSVDQMTVFDGKVVVACGEDLYIGGGADKGWKLLMKGETNNKIKSLTATSTQLFVGTEFKSLTVDRFGRVSDIHLPLVMKQTMIAVSGNLEYVVGMPRRPSTSALSTVPLTVLSSTNKGITWKEDNDGLTRSDVTAFSAPDSPILFAGTGSTHLFMLRQGASSPRWKHLNGQGLAGSINAIWADPKYEKTLVVATDQGLFVSVDGGESFKPSSSQHAGAFQNAISIARVGADFFIGTDVGVFYGVDRIPRGTRFSAWVGRTTEFISRYHDKWWFWPISATAAFLFAYIVGVVALLILAWNRGTTVFSRSVLGSLAAKPLLITPVVGRHLLFLGYNKRLSKIREIERAGKDYFGLPTIVPGGPPVLPDVDGKSLHREVAARLQPQQPGIILGRGGAGKSTVLSRLAYLALREELPESLGKLRPIFVPAHYYSGDLIKAIVSVLRERDGVEVNEAALVAQLQAGGYLVLFDGLTEIDGDLVTGAAEILRKAKDATFSKCRFLISSRPLETSLSAETNLFHLQPLNMDVISMLLPRYNLSDSRAAQVRKQLQSFHEKSVEPLIFFMALTVAQANEGSAQPSRSTLYESYFRRLLRVEGDDLKWSGWRTVLEAIAGWSLIESGNRGSGIAHSQLTKKIGEAETEGGKSLFENVQAGWELPVRSPLSLLQTLHAAGVLVLERGRRWRFAHDTFEEYFAASRIVSILSDACTPDLSSWSTTVEKQTEFLNVLEFVRELSDMDTTLKLADVELPDSWRTFLCCDGATGGSSARRV
jgi:photosystem II stability/assembly factor-like uncharacterized protein